MFNIVLYQPEIPPNTGNIMRLAANTGCNLHLIEPLGFSFDDKHLRRAGLDYVLADPPKFYSSFDAYCEFFYNTIKHTLSHSSSGTNSPIIYLCSTKATRYYTDVTYNLGDSFVFGPETRGLPLEILQAFPEEQKIKIPMKESSRSLNLANSVSVIVYEAWRQNGFVSQK